MMNTPNNQEHRDSLKQFLTNAVKLIVRSKEINKGAVDEQYIKSKKWSSGLDFQTNAMLIDIIQATNINPNDVEDIFNIEGLEGPYALDARRPTS